MQKKRRNKIGLRRVKDREKIRRVLFRREDSLAKLLD
jgi:hypothetical protein